MFHGDNLLNNKTIILLNLNNLTRNTCVAEPRESRSSGEGAPRVETLVASRFAYEAFRRST